MVDPRSELLARLQAAFDTVAPGADPVLRASDRADYQANGALALAKRLGLAPHEVAERVVAAADLADLCQTVEVSGPGFVNLTLTDAYLSTTAAAMSADGRLGVPTAGQPETVVVDYSSPNVAKEMHVGHLRGTIIGDALVRLLEFAGHRVIRRNHIGDWGTPFGMLIEHLVDIGEDAAVRELAVGDLDAFYRQAYATFEADEDFRERSRHRVVLLQSGDAETLRLWQVLVDESVRYFDEVYAKLGILLTDDDIAGESYYNPMLPAVVDDLAARGLLVEDQGAQCVFPPGFTNRDGEPLPVIVRKSDGGFGYSATDLAAVRDRVDHLGADRILYVVGAEQAQHLQMVFSVAALAGWLPERVSAVHVVFAHILGADHKKLKSRTGESVKLVGLLDEAVERAASAIAEREPAATGEDLERAARVLGIGAVKYADLSTERTRDYVFDWDRMLAFEGNTGPYLQYAHARIRSIFRRGEVEVPSGGPPPTLAEPEERALALQLVGFAGAVAAALESYSPSKLTGYLFELATTFTAFYETCPILRAPDAESRRSRLVLADLTAHVLATGLGLLGIEAPERM